MPKRATQHGMFVPSSETEPPTLKPGQKDLHRKGLYTLEAKRAFAATTYLTLDLPHSSEYAAMQKCSPDDYLYRDERSRRAAEFRQETCHSARCFREGVSSSAAHWQSEYKALGQEAGLAAADLRQMARGVPRRWPENKVGIVGCAEDGTAYRDEFGRYGSDPREKVRPEDARMPVLKHELILGTTKVSQHIPNYQGFIPTRASNPWVARAVAGEVRNNLDKVDMADIFHRDLVGYAGHVPHSFRNDLGGRKPTNLTVHGSDFAPFRSARF